jgi:Cof subfamily protein (haloacid dehalogenase superfamily)
VSIPGNRPKLIATDLDGTIVGHYGEISARTVTAFKTAHEMGIEIFFVTGRPPRWMAEIREAFGFGNAICANGALLYDLANSKVIEEWLIPVENQLELTKRLRENIKGINFAIEFESHFHREKSYVPNWDLGIDNLGVENIEELATQPAFKMMARCSKDEMDSDQMLEIAQRVAGDLATFTHSAPNDALIEISATGVSKGATLEKMAARAGLGADDCVTFGDNPNDFSMLSWASRSWAMSNGHPDGAKYAKFVAEPIEADGVAKVIEELIKLPA